MEENAESSENGQCGLSALVCSAESIDIFIIPFIHLAPECLDSLSDSRLSVQNKNQDNPVMSSGLLSSNIVKQNSSPCTKRPRLYNFTV